MEEASPPSSSLILCIFPGCPSIGIIHESMIESLLFFSLQADIAITNTAVANKSLFILYIFKSESMYFRYGRCNINARLIFGDRV
ncbi:hypothetical protein BACSTE_01435 [Bacteroides stercoris ATCC 43183]|uniref:Uncharacterized protein n=1 Tax=Bacteroides stercoris ATCC 43183 TaxID=449673 RepID=B0NPQ6_BACSE|nr:hypothetical protein BACSTE_01435 [Bacteroides stercoris ATCC 43183]